MEESPVKTLYLVRHAKSSREDPTLADEARPLAERGRRDAPKMGRRLAKRGVEPGLIVSSPARRARATAKLLARQLDYDADDIVVDERIYPGGLRALLRVVHGLDGKLKRAMLVGHNPGLEELAHHLTGEVTRMPTSAVAELVFDAKSWRKVGRETLARTALDYPRKS
jgi:phosphohistidine phosphatase